MRTPHFSILDKEHNVVPMDDQLTKWSEFSAEMPNRRVAEDYLKEGTVRVSTVFLGINHGFGGKPLWFETMVFSAGGDSTDYCERYETWDEAVEGHKKAVKEFSEK